MASDPELKVLGTPHNSLVSGALTFCDYQLHSCARSYLTLYDSGAQMLARLGMARPASRLLQLGRNTTFS